MISILGLFGCSELATSKPVGSQLEWIDNVELRWFGVTSLSIRFSDRLWLLDPFFSRPVGGELVPNALGKEWMIELLGQQVDRIWVGHSHYDHALDVRTAALHYDSPVYGSATTCYLVEGLSCHRIDHGWEAVVDGVTVKAIRTSHWRPDWTGVGSYDTLTAPSDDYALAPNGGVLSFHMQFPNGQSIFFQDTMGPLNAVDGSGETYADNMAQVSELPIDLWLACGNCLTEPSELAAYVSLLNPAQVIPIHWDGAMPDPESPPTYVSDPTWEAVFSDFAIPAEPFSGYNQPVVLQNTESF